MSARKAEGHKVKTLTLKYYWNYISMFLKNSNEKKTVVTFLKMILDLITLDSCKLLKCLIFFGAGKETRTHDRSKWQAGSRTFWVFS